MAILFALIALVGWGVGDIFGTKVARKIGNVYGFFWLHIFALLFSSLYIPWAGRIENFTYLLLAFLLGLIVSFSSLLYFRGLEVGNASLVGTIAGSFSIITIALSMIFFGEKVTLVQLMGIILVILGVILSSFKIEDSKRKTWQSFLSNPGIIYALIAMVGWGIYFAFIRIPAEKIGWFWSYYPANFTAFLLIPFGLIKSNAFDIFKKPQTFTHTVLFMILVTIATFAYNLGILRGLTSIVAPISGSYPVLFVILTRIVFKDRLSRQQKLGVISALAGILVISFASVEKV